ncbi:MAG: bacteriohopanetetrol glucosamine biosynthesis glycosyltransferase HpnI [Bryobacterales bacterium]|nr:bacteriohopanetetrol glucosamine biosynthesis glycosyltransferase HpnI [Bryobacterales bacterium]
MTWLLALPAVAASCYYLLALAAVLRSRKPAACVPAKATPPVSILKPLRGRDPGLYDALRSHAAQDYPEFEILFGVSDPSDAALEDVRRLIREFPRVPMRVVAAGREAPNGKVGVLIHLAREARHPLLLVNDSDITVPADYLRSVIPHLEDPAAGMVTCLYRARAAAWPGRFEALGISTDFAPSVLVSRLIGKVDFGLGATLAFRNVQLQAIGGFEALAEHIADDYELGRRIARLGYRVVLSPTVVETRLPGATWGEIWRHQVRWARTIRRAHAGYAGLVITNATFWSLAALAAGAWPLALAAFALRMAVGLAAGLVILSDREVLRLAPLIPLRDLWALAVWAAGLFGRTVEWRGEIMRLTPDGRILPLHPPI